MSNPALLALEDGSLFYGTAVGAQGSTAGEVVFNTAMTGYQEILTDPSYARQMVMLTYPHIGNTGTNAQDNESDRVWPAGLIIRDLPLLASNYRNDRPLDVWLRDNNIVAIAGIDTRRLTRLLREKGVQAGCIVTGTAAADSDAAVTAARGFPGLAGADLAREVSVSEAYTWTEGSWQWDLGHTRPAPDSLDLHVVAYDYGCKRNILRMLVDRGCRITVVPATTPAKEVLALAPDGVFLSNGPGDPEPCDYAVRAITSLLDTDIPVFGICLGHQLLALASGGRTLKMKFGHHGANHPVQNLHDGTVMITSQNHSFAVDDSALPDNLRVTHRSLFDGSLQGIHRTDRPAFSFQGHPEASPGPHDAAPLFDHFIGLMRARVAQD